MTPQQAEHRDTLEIARHVLQCQRMYTPGTYDLARAVVGLDTENQQLCRERDAATKTPLGNGLYLSIQDTVYRVEIQDAQSPGVCEIVKLCKLASEGEIYHVVRFSTNEVSCECASWTFRLSKEPDHRAESSFCKHARACRAAGLIQLPPPVTTKRNPEPIGV